MADSDVRVLCMGSNAVANLHSPELLVNGRMRAPEDVLSLLKMLPPRLYLREELTHLVISDSALFLYPANPNAARRVPEETINRALGGPKGAESVRYECVIGAGLDHFVNVIDKVLAEARSGLATPHMVHVVYMCNDLVDPKTHKIRVLSMQTLEKFKRLMCGLRRFPWAAP